MSRIWQNLEYLSREYQNIQYLNTGVECWVIFLYLLHHHFDPLYLGLLAPHTYFSLASKLYCLLEMSRPQKIPRFSKIPSRKSRDCKSMIPLVPAYRAWLLFLARQLSTVAYPWSGSQVQTPGTIGQSSRPESRHQSLHLCVMRKTVRMRTVPRILEIDITLWNILRLYFRASSHTKILKSIK